MDQILQQVRRARRRLWFELLLRRLLRCWFATLIVAAVAVALPRLAPMENLPPGWTAWWLGGAMAAGLLAALVWTWLRGRSALEAAMEIDRRFELKERIASSLSLTPEAADTPAGRALLNDASRAIGRLEISERFRIRIGRAAWLPLAPAALAAAIVLLLDPKQAQSSTEPTAKVSKQTVQTAAKSLRKKLEDPKKLAQKQGLKEAEALLTKLEKSLEQLAAKKDLDKKQTLVKLNDLAKQLQERRDKLGGDNELKKQLAGMKDFSRGPADKLMDALKQGDWEKAKQELAKLQKELNQGKLDDAAKKEMANQLDQLKQKLQQAAAERKQAIDGLKKQIEDQKKKGNLAEAGQLQQKLDELQKQQRQNQKLDQLAQQLAQAQQALQQGDKAAASQAMQQLVEQLEQMQKEGREGEMLQAAMDQLEMAKSAMDCAACQGEGCEKCQGAGNTMSNRFSEKFGNGMGAGRGVGPRPDEKNDVAFRDSQVKQKPSRGAMVVTGEADGPNIRGNVRQSIQEEMAAEASQPADPLVIEQLPKAQREHAEDYFNRLRDGE